MNLDRHARDAAHWNSEALRRSNLYNESGQDHFSTAFAYGRDKLHRILRRALQQLGPAAPVLDVGCGTGAQLAIGSELDLKMVGVEPSNNLRSVARQLNPGVNVLEGSITNLPFEDAAFEFAYAIEVLRYFPRSDRLTAYREVLRVLRPGGQFFFTMSNKFALDGFALYSGLKQFTCRAKRIPWPSTYFVTPRAVRREFAELGVTDVQFCGCVFAPVRIAYRIAPRVAPRIASALDPIEEALLGGKRGTSVAGHLIVTARKP